MQSRNIGSEPEGLGFQSSEGRSGAADFDAGTLPLDQPTFDPLANTGSDVEGDAQSQAQGVKDKASAVTDQLKEKAEVGKDKAGEVAQEAGHKADAGIQKSAEGLKKAADKARAVGEDQSGTLGTVSTQAADVLDKGADFLEHNDTEQLIAELETLVRKRPVESLLVAAGVGFLFARSMR